MPDVRVKVTPDLKPPGNALILVDLSGGQARLGGSALAQVWQQLGDQTPDVDDASNPAQSFLPNARVVAAGRVAAAPRSQRRRPDHRGRWRWPSPATPAWTWTGPGWRAAAEPAADPLAALFAEELGVVLETGDADRDAGHADGSRRPRDGDRPGRRPGR